MRLAILIMLLSTGIARCQMNGTQILHDCTTLTENRQGHTQLDSINSGHLHWHGQGDNGDVDALGRS